MANYFWPIMISGGSNAAGLVLIYSAIKRLAAPSQLLTYLNTQRVMDRYNPKGVVCLVVDIIKDIVTRGYGDEGMADNRATVLAVEDEALVRMNIIMSLEQHGFEVHGASNADETIEMLQSYPEIRLMFTDIDMPGSMDGLKLAVAVRDRWPPIHIIVTSGQNQLTDEMLPVSGRFFAKPYIHSQIADVMDRMIGSS